MNGIAVPAHAPRTTSETVTDPAGMVWRMQDMYAVSGLMALFTMGAFTSLGLAKLMAVSRCSGRQLKQGGA